MRPSQGFIPDRTPTEPARLGPAVAETALSDATVAGLDRLGRGDPRTLHALLTAAVAALQHLYTARRRVVVGVPAPDGEGVVPLELEVAPDSTLPGLAAAVEGGSRSGSHTRVAVGLEELHGDACPPVPLAFSFARGAGLRLAVRYEPGRYDRSSVERIVWHLRLLLGTLAAGPRVPLRAVELRTPEDDRWLAAHLGPPVRLGVPETVNGLFDAQAAAHPDAVAVMAGTTRLTYAGLRRSAGRLADTLRERGVGSGVIVGVRAEPTPSALVAVLAVLGAGGAFLPLDPRCSPDRVTDILTDSGAAFVIGPSGLETAPRPARAPVSGLACVRYAPTGPLRGVAVGHRSLAWRIAWMQRAYPLGTGDTVLTRSPLSLWWMRGGAAACLLEPALRSDPAAVGAAGVTTLYTTPGELARFLDRLEEIRAVAGLSRLRRVFCGGAALGPGLVRRFHRLLSSASLRPRLVNLYGQAETGSVAAHFPCDDPRPDRVLIGTAVDNVRLYVVDDGMRIRPVGVPGELCVAGEGLATGYLHHERLTRERFVTRPFPRESRAYLTGDLVRWLPDGSVEHLGRADGGTTLGETGMRVLQRSCSA
jgi:non-ribosomal peptide synthetase component F